MTFLFVYSVQKHFLVGRTNANNAHLVGCRSAWCSIVEFFPVFPFVFSFLLIIFVGFCAIFLFTCSLISRPSAPRLWQWWRRRQQQQQWWEWWRWMSCHTAISHFDCGNRATSLKQHRNAGFTQISIWFPYLCERFISMCTIQCCSIRKLNMVVVLR